MWCIGHTCIKNKTNVWGEKDNYLQIKISYEIQQKISAIDLLKRKALGRLECNRFHSLLPKDIFSIIDTMHVTMYLP